MKKIFNLTNIIFAIILLFFMLMLAFLIPYAWNKITMINNFWFSWARLGFGFGAWMIITLSLIFYMHFRKSKNFQGKLATSDFMDKKTFNKVTHTFSFKEKFADGFIVKTSLSKNRQNLQLSILDRIGHSLIIGSTNSGKTALIVDPQIRVLGRSMSQPTMFISDPKGELFAKHAQALHNEGYEVLSINLRNETLSSFWNPLEKIWKRWHLGGEAHHEQAKADLSELASALFPENTSGKDSFWVGGANTVFQFFALALLEISQMDETIKLEHFNITNLLNNIQQTTDEELEEIIIMLPKNSAALQVGGRNVRGEAKQTLQNLFQNVITSLKIYSDPIIKRVTSKTTIQIDNKNPQAIFIIVPDESKAKYPFISLFVSETYKEIIQSASREKHQQLLRPVYYILEEFGNLPKIPHMDAMLSVSRSRNIFFMLIVQNYAQLNQTHGKDIATTIIANCAVEYFILSNEFETAKRFSDKLGDKSLITSSRSSSSNAKGSSSSRSESERTRKLVHPDELMNLKFTEMIIKIQRQKPLKVITSKFFEWKNFDIGHIQIKPNPREKKHDQKHLKLLIDSQSQAEFEEEAFNFKELANAINAPSQKGED